MAYPVVNPNHHRPKSKTSAIDAARTRRRQIESRPTVQRKDPADMGLRSSQTIRDMRARSEAARRRSIKNPKVTGNTSGSRGGATTKRTTGSVPTTPAVTIPTAPTAPKTPQYGPSTQYWDERNRVAAEWARRGLGNSSMLASALGRAEAADRERWTRDQMAQTNMYMNAAANAFNTDWARYLQSWQIQGNDKGLRAPQDFNYMAMLQNFNPYMIQPGTTPSGQGQMGDPPPGEKVARYEPNRGATQASRDAANMDAYRNAALALQRRQVELAEQEFALNNSPGAQDEAKWQSALGIISGNIQQDQTDPNVFRELRSPNEVLKTIEVGLGLDLKKMAQDTNPDVVSRERAREAILTLYGTKSKYSGRGQNIWVQKNTGKVGPTAGAPSTEPVGGFLPFLQVALADIPHRMGEFFGGSSAANDEAFNRSLLAMYKRAFGNQAPEHAAGPISAFTQYDLPHYEQYIKENWNK